MLDKLWNALAVHFYSFFFFLLLCIEVSTVRNMEVRRTRIWYTHIHTYASTNVHDDASYTNSHSPSKYTSIPLNNVGTSFVAPFSFNEELYCSNEGKEWWKHFERVFCQYFLFSIPHCLFRHYIYNFPFFFFFSFFLYFPLVSFLLFAFICL